MAYPTLRSGSPADTTNASTNSLNVSLGATAAAGDYAVILGVAAGDPPGNLTTPTGGWSREVYENPGFLCRLVVYHKLCDGTEGSLVAIPNSATVRMSARAYLFAAGTFTGAPQFSARTVNANSGSSDPPSLTPSFGEKDAFWLAVALLAGANSGNATTYPTGWSNPSRFVEGGGGSSYRIATATKTQRVVSDDPSQFEWPFESTGNVSFTMALQGVEASTDVAGSVALSLTATGSIAVAKPVSGTVAVALATSGSIAVAKPVAGGVSLALSATGAIAVNKPVAGSVAMGVACSGALTVPKPVAGSVAVGLTAAGSVAVAKPVSGAVAVALTTSGALTTVGMGGAVAVSVATAGSVAVAKPVSGAVLVSLTTAAALTIAKPVSGNVALSLVTSGSVQVAKPVAGAVSVALTAAGAVQVPKLLGGAVSVHLTAGGSVAVAKPVGGAVLLSLTTTGRIETATLRGLVTAVLTLRSTPTALTLRPTDATLTTRAGSAALTLRPATDAALQFQTDDPV